MRKQLSTEKISINNNLSISDKNCLSLENKILKCLDCEEILIINWLNETERILICSNNQVIIVFITIYIYIFLMLKFLILY